MSFRELYSLNQCSLVQEPPLDGSMKNIECNASGSQLVRYSELAASMAAQSLVTMKKPEHTKAALAASLAKSLHTDALDKAVQTKTNEFIYVQDLEKGARDELALLRQQITNLSVERDELEVRLNNFQQIH